MEWFLIKAVIKNSGLHIPGVLLSVKFCVSGIELGLVVLAESRPPWTHVNFGAVISVKLAFYCR